MTGVRLGGVLYTSRSGSSGIAAEALSGRRGREDGGAPHSADENPPTPEAPAEGSPSKGTGDRHVIQLEKSESIPETGGEKQEKEHGISSKPPAGKSSSAPSKTESSENLQDCACREEESSCESLLLEGTCLKDEDVPKKLAELDNSAFLDEDSNQPMPLDRFFGNIDFIQDQPAAVLPSTTMSRREYRRLHFIAKEDEEEDEDVL